MATVTAPAPMPATARTAKVRGARRGAFGILFAPVTLPDPALPAAAA